MTSKEREKCQDGFGKRSWHWKMKRIKKTQNDLSIIQSIKHPII